MSRSAADDDREYFVDFLIIKTLKVHAGDEIQAEKEAARLLGEHQRKHVQKVRVRGDAVYNDKEWWT